MKITCDNCGASYKIPDQKLTRDVSRATCKKCGHKIVIRKEGQGAYEDPRMVGSFSSSDDDGVVNHEERTVIAQVPELGNYDSASAGTAGVAGADALLGLVNSSPAAEAATQRTGEAPAVARSGTTAPVSPSRATVETPPAVVPAPAAAPPWAPTVVSAPAPGVFSPSPFVAAPLPAPAPVPVAALRARGSWASVGALGISLFGLLLYVPNGLWGISQLQAAGFVLALFGVVAVALTLVDLTRTGRFNAAKVFAIPAIVIALMMGSLLNVQASELAFLKPEIKDISLLKEVIQERLKAPDKPDEPIEKSVARRAEQKSKRVVRPLATANIPDTSNLTVPGGSGTDGGGLQTNTGVSGTTTGQVETISSAPTPRPGIRRPEQVGMASKFSWSEDQKGLMQDNFNERRVRACFNNPKYRIPSKVSLRVFVAPTGELVEATITDPPELRASEVESCLNEWLRRLSFPTHDSDRDQPHNYTYKF